PAAYPSVIAVGATSYFDTRASYSNQGADLDIMAPGGLSTQAILSTWTSDPDTNCPKGLREVSGGFYCELDGTSMATGVATGVAALIMGLRPDLDADEIQEILLDSAAPLNGPATSIGHGRLDAANAVRLALEPDLFFTEEGFTASALEGSDP